VSHEHISADDERTLLLAAKAAGVKIQWSNNFGDFTIGEPYSRGEVRWNPREDDGDAMRLLCIVWKFKSAQGVDFWRSGPVKLLAAFNELFAALAAGEPAKVRHAIVAVAAEIGSGM
jgi:hypothetical protein